MPSQSAPKRRRASGRTPDAVSPPREGGKRARKPSLKSNLNRQADEERQGALDQRDLGKKNSRAVRVARQSLKLVMPSPKPVVRGSRLHEQSVVDEDDESAPDEDEGDINALFVESSGPVNRKRECKL